jgi:hypothetical protein
MLVVEGGPLQVLGPILIDMPVHRTYFLAPQVVISPEDYAKGD